MKKLLILIISFLIFSTASAADGRTYSLDAYDVDVSYENYEAYAVSEHITSDFVIIEREHGVTIRANARTKLVLQVDFKEPGSQVDGIVIGDEWDISKPTSKFVSLFFSDKFYYNYQMNDGSYVRYAVDDNKVVEISKLSSDLIDEIF